MLFIRKAIRSDEGSNIRHLPITTDTTMTYLRTILVGHARSVGHHGMNEWLPQTIRQESILRDYTAISMAKEMESGVVDWRSFRNVDRVNFVITVSVPRTIVMIRTEEKVHEKATVFYLESKYKNRLNELNVPYLYLEFSDILRVIVGENLDSIHDETVVWLNLMASSIDHTTLMTHDHPDAAVLIHPVFKLLETHPKEVKAQTGLLGISHIWR